MLLLFICVLACDKNDDIVIPNDPVDGDSIELDIIWQTPLHNNVRRKRGLKPMIVGDLVITTFYDVGWLEEETIIAFNRFSGEEVWRWHDYPDDTPTKGIRNEYYLPLNGSNLLFQVGGDYLIYMDLSTGTPIWVKDIRRPESEISVSGIHRIHGQTAYFSVNLTHQDQSASSELWTVNLDNAEIKTVRTITQRDGMSPALLPPLVLFQGSDTILVHSQHYWDPQEARFEADLISYNISVDSMEWSHIDFEPFGIVNGRGVVGDPDGELAYLFGHETVYCIDPVTGEFEWSYYSQDGPGFTFSEFDFHNDHLIYKMSNGPLKCLNKFTGEPIWIQYNAGAYSDGVTLYNERIYYSDGKLWIVDIKTGEVLYNKYSPNTGSDHPATYYTLITIDEKNEWIYTHDGYFMMCIEIPTI